MDKNISFWKKNSTTKMISKINIIFVIRHVFIIQYSPVCYYCMIYDTTELYFIRMCIAYFAVVT